MYILLSQEVGKSNFTVGNPTNIILVRWSRLTPAVISHVDDVQPWFDMMRKVLHLSGLLLQTQNPSLIMRKTSGSPKLRGTYLTSTPQNCPGNQKQGKSEKLSQPRGEKETWWLNVMWYLDGILEPKNDIGWNPRKSE